ncbi:MAG TPA: hypothetical protein VMT63_10610 [Bacteroidales bacterium]|nr:hypothetical protein [Bacteroidales bacterium]
MNNNSYRGVVKTKQQMADEFGICRKTFNRLMLKKNIRLERGLIYPRDQRSIYEALGSPGDQGKISATPKL